MDKSMGAYLVNRPITRLCLAAIAYSAIMWAGFFFIPAAGATSLVWPASAAGLALMYFWGYEIWPAIALPAFLIFMAQGVTPSHALAAMAGNLLEPLIGVYLLRRIEFDPLISCLRDAMGLIFACVVPTLASAIIIMLVTTYSGAAVVPSSLWLSLWVGHSVSLLAFAPFALYWGNRTQFKKTPRELAEGAAVFGLIAVVDILESWTHYTTIGPFALVYILVVLLIWSSLRTGPRGITLALIMTALITMAGVLLSHVAQQNAAQTLLQTQILIGVLIIIFLPFTAIVEERKNAIITLEGHVVQLEDAVQKISLEDEAKSDFIAILAHELRNPLSPILSNLELIKQNGTHAHNTSNVESIASHVHVMARLLDDLLDISRISQKKFRLDRSPVELGAVIHHAIEMAQPFINSRGHTLNVTLPQEPIWLNADPVRLAQIFVNILNNSAKYTDAGGRIELTVVRAGGTAVVRISDNGIGIEPERLPRIFDSFGGAEGAARSRGGLRIGLSIAKRMVELHQGRIVAASAGVGRGSEFIVTLPLPVLSPLPLPPSESRQQRSRFSSARLPLQAQNSKVRVLVVDDNEAAAKSLGMLLERNGHPIDLAFSGEVALTKARQRRPDAVLLDIGLPDMDGHEVGRRLRAEHGAKLIIVALTGYGQAEDRQKAAAAGFDRHLTKPATIVDVEHALAELRKN